MIYAQIVERIVQYSEMKGGTLLCIGQKKKGLSLKRKKTLVEKYFFVQKIAHKNGIKIIENSTLMAIVGIPNLNFRCSLPTIKTIMLP